MIREELVIFCLLFEGGMNDSSVYTLKQVNGGDGYVIILH